MQKLDELVLGYARHKAEEGELKKVCDSENAQIKDIMFNEKLSKYEVEGWQVNYIESTREKMNEDKLLDLLKKSFTKKQLKKMKLIKTVEQVDESALENAIYNNLVGADFVASMASCKESTVVTSLRLTQKKGK